MSIIKLPSTLWSRDCAVFHVGTTEANGESMLFRVGFITVEDRQITTTSYFELACGRPRANAKGMPATVGVRRASGPPTASAALSSSDSVGRKDPGSLLRLVKELMRTASKNRSVIVTHALRPGLADLLAAVEQSLGVELPPVYVIVGIAPGRRSA